MAKVTGISFEPGFIVISTDEGAPRKYSAKDFLQAADIPDLTINSLTLLTTLAKLFMVLLKELQDKEIIQEELTDGYDFQYLYDTLVQELNVEE